MQDNIDNESMTGLNVPAFANVLPIPGLAKHSHLNVGDETMNFCTRQDADAGGLNPFLPMLTTKFCD